MLSYCFKLLLTIMNVAVVLLFIQIIVFPCFLFLIRMQEDIYFVSEFDIALVLFCISTWFFSGETFNTM